MKTYRIVIVENDEDEQLFMREGFESDPSFKIIAQLRNGNELEKWFDNHSDELPDLVLTDLNMPGKNGYDIIASIRQSPQHAHIPVIVTSTSSARSMIDKCLTLGAADYLVKPDTFIEYGHYVADLKKRIEEKHLLG